MKSEIEIGRIGVRFSEEKREWRLPDVLYADNLVLCGELWENERDDDILLKH